jgi:hypothetical protein
VGWTWEDTGFDGEETVVGQGEFVAGSLVLISKGICPRTLHPTRVSRNRTKLDLRFVFYPLASNIYLFFPFLLMNHNLFLSVLYKDLFYINDVR